MRQVSPFCRHLVRRSAICFPDGNLPHQVHFGIRQELSGVRHRTASGVVRRQAPEGPMLTLGSDSHRLLASGGLLDG